MSHPWEISVTEAQAKLAGPKRDIVLIDCREVAEFDFCHLDQALLLPLSEFAAQVAEKLTDKEAEYIVYCHHGVRSLEAVSYLRTLNYSRSSSVRGGIDAWSTEIDSSVPRY